MKRDVPALFSLFAIIALILADPHSSGASYLFLPIDYRFSFVAAVSCVQIGLLGMVACAVALWRWRVAFLTLSIEFGLFVTVLTIAAATFGSERFVTRGYSPGYSPAILVVAGLMCRVLLLARISRVTKSSSVSAGAELSPPRVNEDESITG